MTDPTNVELFLVKEGSGPLGGEQRLYEFPNGWAASVIRNQYSYGGSEGLWELAVLEGANGPLNYNTPVTDDVMGYLTEEELEKVLTQIFMLRERKGSGWEGPRK